MNNRAVTISLLMAVVAVFFVNSYVTSLEENAKKKYGEDTLVVVAKEDIKELQTLKRDSFTVMSVPKNFVQPGYIGYTQGEKKDENDISDFRQFEGTVALIPIKKGEQITYSKISEPGIRTGLAPQITPGKRAVAIPVSDSSAAGRLIKPGDRVDIILTMSTGSNAMNKVAKTIAQDVTVLATGRSIVNNVPRVLEGEANGKEKIRNLANQIDFNSIIIEVEPQMVPPIALASSMGPSAIQVILRTNDDMDKVNMPQISLNEVMGVVPDVRMPANQVRPPVAPFGGLR